MRRSIYWGRIAVMAVAVTLAAACADSQATQGARSPSQSASPQEQIAVTEVPYRWVKHQRLIDVRIKNQGPFTFLVDTGVSGAAIDLELATRLGIELPEGRADRMSSGAFAQGVIYQTYMTDLSIGSLHIKRLQAAALSLQALGQRLGEPLHGILGDGFLSRRVTRFDDAQQTLSFASSLQAFSQDLAEADWVTPLVISPSGDMPILEVRLGEQAFIATLDMGSSLGLEIFAPFIDEFGLGHAPREWQEGTVLGGSLGRATVYDGTVERIDIGPLTLTDVPTSITPPRSDPNRKGNLGNRLWEGYVLILDYVDNNIVIRKAPKEGAYSFERQRFLNSQKMDVFSGTWSVEAGEGARRTARRLAG